MTLEEKFKELLKTPLDFQTAQKNIVESLRETFGLSRVNIFLYNKPKQMLEAVSSVGHPHVDLRDIRTPVLRMAGISARAVQCRSFFENKTIVIRNREKDPEYRMRHKFPHKSYAREFAIFPLAYGARKLGVLSIAVDQNNPTKLTPDLTARVEKLSKTITRIILATIPKIPSDAEMMKVLKEIFRKGLLYNVFQPIVDIEKKEIHAYESLLRIHHPLIKGPTMLLDYAEKFNELRDVSHFSHYNAVGFLKSLAPGQKMFMNLAPKDFEEYLDIERDSNPFHRQDLSKIVFEITERSYADDAQRLNSTLKFFKGLGAGIAIDDLGSGYSSLEMLTILEPDYLKLDMSLIRNIHQNDRKEKLVKTLLFYGDQIGCRCIAEGVETKAEFDVLTSLNCKLIQGYFISPPTEKLQRNDEMKQHLEESFHTIAESPPVAHE